MGEAGAGGPVIATSGRNAASASTDARAASQSIVRYRGGPWISGACTATA